MATSIEPLCEGVLPDMGKSFWRLTGPGATALYAGFAVYMVGGLTTLW